MLWTIAVIMLALWLLGLVSSLHDGRDDSQPAGGCHCDGAGQVETGAASGVISGSEERETMSRSVAKLTERCL